MTKFARLLTLALFALLLMTAIPALAQGDPVPLDEPVKITLGEPVSVTFAEAQEQAFLQFEAAPGAIIYAAGTNPNPGQAPLVFEIRDSVGRDISFASDEFPISPYTVAELPDGGNYTAVVTNDGFSGGTYTVVVDQTGFLSEEPFTAIFEAQDPPVIYRLDVDEDARYNLILTRKEGGSLPIEFKIVDFTERTTGVNIIRFFGEDTDRWELTVNLKAENTYVAVLESGVFTTVFLEPGTDLTTQFNVVLVPFEE